MNDTPTIIGVIPARGGSKGIPGKNIIPVRAKPLIVYTIEAARESGVLTQTVVTSDDDAILRVAEAAGATPLKRPLKLASDTASSEVAVMHALDTLENEGKTFDLLLLLQPTSPLRTARDIQNAVKLFREKNASALISVYEPEHSPYKAFTVNNEGFLQGIVDNASPFRRRQDLPKAYYPNGAIYLITVEAFRAGSAFYTDHTVPYIMPSERSIDVDTMDDVRRIEEIMGQSL